MSSREEVLGEKISRREFLKILGAFGITSIGGVALQFVGKGITPSQFVDNVYAQSLCDSPETRGMWNLSTTVEGVVGMHIAVLHTGKVVLFFYNEGGYVPSPDADEKNVANMTIQTLNPNISKCALWDPATSKYENIRLNRALYCSGHSMTGNGQLFVIGGQFGADAPSAAIIATMAGSTEPFRYIGNGATRDIHRFLPSGGYLPRTGITEDGGGSGTTWLRVKPDMEKGRWYPTCVTMASGEILAISGTDAPLGLITGMQNTMQIFSENGVDRSPVKALPFEVYHWYPFLHVLPSGKIFAHSRKRTFLYDPIADKWDTTTIGLTNFAYSRTHYASGTSVLLPLRPQKFDFDFNTNTGKSEYPKGRVLILGGPEAEGPSHPEPEPFRTRLTHTTPATDTAEIIDFDDLVPAWRYTREPMHNRRVLPNAVILPDGNILVLQGSSRGTAGGFFVNFPTLGPALDYNIGADMPVYQPELFDPISEKWTVMCHMKIYRLYHSTAALLPDGRVLSAGHDGLLNRIGFRKSQYQLEIFSPPYLFRGPRPEFDPRRPANPNPVGYNEIINIPVRDSSEISKVVIVRGSSVTHNVNSDQRLIELPIIQPIIQPPDGSNPDNGTGGVNITGTGLGNGIPTTENGTGVNITGTGLGDGIPTVGPERFLIRVISPPDGGVAPPGYYMLFLLNHKQVPSVAQWIQIPVPAENV